MHKYASKKYIGYILQSRLTEGAVNINLLNTNDIYYAIQNTMAVYIVIFIHLYLQRNIYVYSLLTNQKINGQFPLFHVHL